MDAMKSSCENLNLQSEQTYLDKVIQLYERALFDTV